ncbi:hypothetical protein HanXRQr2_Chr01g0012611 [Helianthus annuus]|uniref:Uncharacterized protein n=1 Tax=Helianthus annuus TaxID=4232 RepID=A0A9K3JTW1_HELAN|nr:hypothetical protein HanXRQr2_Chr01g0012611 [Helianthus annuus]
MVFYTYNSSRSSLYGVLNLHSSMCSSYVLRMVFYTYIHDVLHLHSSSCDSYGVLHLHSSICSSYGVLNLHSSRLHIMLYIFFSLYKYSNVVLILKIKIAPYYGVI